MNKKNIGGIVLAGLWLVSPIVQANEPLQVQVPAAYDSDAYVVPRVKNDCAVESIVGDNVFQKIAEKRPDAQQVQDPAKMATGKVLKLTIISVQGIGGGGWTGSKGITVRADLMQDGRLVQSTQRKERSRGGLLGPVLGTCAILQDVGEALGQHFATWLAKVDSEASAAPAAQSTALSQLTEQINDQPEP
ncbi:hypothetical protein [Herbaspirillum rhizosphaerae]|uniref:hypothetical protein n=1 Tax=Herbaspirillum rhizosphaerae TaxID=346179 RepID=UPI00067B5F40|nr:hypothetical protein [Herbaspirillum rhizosphaerae]